MSYGLDQIYIEGLTLAELEELEIKCQPSEHGKLHISGYLPPENGKNTLFELNEYAPISISVANEGQKKKIFSGLVTAACVRSQGGYHHIDVEAKTYSLLLDLKKKSRSYQNTSITYGSLVTSVLSDYPGSDINLSIVDQPIGEIAVQYRETDWQFMKRMLSLLHAPLSCYPVMEGIKLYGGIPDIPQGGWPYKRVKTEKELGKYNYWQQQGSSVSDGDFLIYTIETDHTPELFEQVCYGEQIFTVREYSYIYKQGLLHCFCELQKKTGILQLKQYPMHLIGVALEGKILDVSGDQVKLLLAIDGEDSKKSVYWFPYSTLSASPDGSGWYYMPERGDHVRVYFPSKYTKDVIAISAVSEYDGKTAPASGKGSATAAAGKKGSGSDRMGNPSTKYLSNPGGQEMSLAADGIDLTCAGGAASLHIGNDGKVGLSAQNELMIGAKNNISITAETDVVLHGKSSVAIICSQGGRIQASDDGNLYIRGTEVKID